MTQINQHASYWVYEDQWYFRYAFGDRPPFPYEQEEFILSCQQDAPYDNYVFVVCDWAGFQARFKRYAKDTIDDRKPWNKDERRTLPPS